MDSLPDFWHQTQTGNQTAESEQAERKKKDFIVYVIPNKDNQIKAKNNLVKKKKTVKKLKKKPRKLDIRK